jgi:ligand-binding sensor domain-containing protein/signal transduction histidine kinase
MKSFSVFLFILFSLKSFAQNHDLHFEHLTVANGLPENNITALLQDKLGYIWIGTQNGLVRYDGYGLKVYKLGSEKRDNSKFFMPTCLFEDKDGILWVGTVHDGIFLYNRESDDFAQYQSENMKMNEQHSYRVIEIIGGNENDLWIRYKINPDATGKNIPYGLERFNTKKHTFVKYPYLVNCFLKIQDGELWFGTTRGLLYYNPHNNKMTDVPLPLRGFAGQFLIFNLYEAPSAAGVLWFNIKDMKYKSLGFFCYNSLNGSFKQYINNKADIFSLPTDSVDAIHEDRQQCLWIATWKGLSLVNRKEGKFKTFMPDDKTPISSDDYNYYRYQIREDADGRLWLTTNNGLLSFDTKKEIFKRYATDERKPYSLNINFIKQLLFDKTGLLWAGLDYGGVDHVNGMRSQFDFYPFDDNLKYSCAQSYGYGISPGTDGYFWLGSKSGLLRWKPDQSAFAKIKLPPVVKPGWVVVFCVSRDGLLWCTSQDHKPFTYSIKTGAVDTFKQHPPWPDTTFEINHIYEDHTGVTWIGTVNDGLYSYKEKTGKFSVYPAEPTVSGSTYSGKKLDDKQIRSIYEDSEGTVWVGTNIGGLNRFNRSDGTFTSFYNLRKGFYSVQSIYEDRAKQLWVGTYLSGLVLFDRKTGKSHSFTELNGLLYNEVLGIMEDGKGNLWLNGERGLSSMDTKTYKFTNYTIDGALPCNCLAHPNRASGNQFVYASPNGLLAFYPDRLEKNPYPPQINIESVSYNDLRLKKDSFVKASIYRKNQLELLHNQNQVHFNFIALHYENPEQNQYAYQLDGYDPGWIYSGTQRSVTYTNLPPGSYTFKVKGASSDGVWNTGIAELKIVIFPPWWITWWAYTLYGAMFALAVYFFVVYRTRKLLKDKDSLERQISVRTREMLRQQEELEAQREKIETEKIRSGIAADFHDELGSTLSSIALYSEMVLTDNFEDKQRTKNILSLISESSRGTVAAMQDMIWTIQPKNDSMLEVIHRMREYAYPMAELKNIQLSFDIGENVPELVLPMDTRKNAWLVFKEALNNAFKYASATNILISISTKDDDLLLKIADDGCGFNPADTKRGNGLKNMCNRAELIGGSLFIESMDPHGTQIIFTCLLKQALL